MNRHLLISFIIACMFIASLFAAFDAPVRAQGPVENAQATLFAATLVVQQTRDAREADRAEQQATAMRLQVLQQEQTATRAAVAATETSSAKTATAQAQVATAQAQVVMAQVQETATARANATATAIADANATETAEANASATAQAQASATAQVADVQAQQTQEAQATETQQAFAAKQLDLQLQRQQAVTFATSAGLFAGTSILLTVLALVGAWKVVRLEPKLRLRPAVIEVASFETERAAAHTQAYTVDASADLDVPFPFGTPVTISTDEDTARELYSRLKDAWTISATPALPPTTSS